MPQNPDAMSQIMAESQTAPVLRVQDPAQVHWLNLLPVTSGMSVIKLGATRIEIIKALAIACRRPIACVGGPHGPAPDSLTISYPSWQAAPQKAFDLAVVDEADDLTSLKTAARLRTELKSILAVLKQDGCLVLCLPEGLRNVRMRYLLAEAVAYSGFHAVDSYLCDPSCERPLEVVPFSANPSWALQYLSRPGVWDSGGTLRRLKRILKWFVFAATGIHNPLRGLLLIARRSLLPATRDGLSCYGQVLRQVTAGLPDSGQPIAVLSATSQGKQYLSIYDSRTSDLLAVAKVGRKCYRHSDIVEQEHQNLRLLSPLVSFLGEKGIIIPQLLGVDVSEQTIFFSMKAMPGRPFESTVRPLVKQGDRRRIEELLNAVVERHIFLQDFLTNRFSAAIPEVAPKFFETPLRVAGRVIEGKAFPLVPFGFVQHGDFSTINIYFDPLRDRWGVIDWESLGRGYPPLVDLFSLLRTVGFRENPRSRSHRRNEPIQSFIDSFFRRNWFSQYCATVVRRYSAACGIDVRIVYDCFLLFILFFYNRYALDEVVVEGFADLYKEMMAYSVANQHQFALL